MYHRKKIWRKEVPSTKNIKTVNLNEIEFHGDY